MPSQPAILMAAAPVKQRSGTRAQLPPCYYEGYLEKRGPKEKVGAAIPPICKCRCIALHCMLCEWLHSVAQIARTGRGRIPWKSQSAKAVNFLIVCEWASLEKAGSDFHLAVHLLIAHDY